MWHPGPEPKRSCAGSPWLRRPSAWWEPHHNEVRWNGGPYLNSLHCSYHFLWRVRLYTTKTIWLHLRPKRPEVFQKSMSIDARNKNREPFRRSDSHDSRMRHGRRCIHNPSLITSYVSRTETLNFKFVPPTYLWVVNSKLSIVSITQFLVALQWLITSFLTAWKSRGPLRTYSSTVNSTQWSG